MNDTDPQRAKELGCVEEYTRLRARRHALQARFEDALDRPMSTGDRRALISASRQLDHAMRLEIDILLGYWPELHDYYRQLIEQAREQAANCERLARGEIVTGPTGWATIGHARNVLRSRA